MVTFLTTVLCVAIVGLVSLLAVKRWELQSGRLLLSGIRPKAGYALGQGLHFVERGLPTFVRNLAVRGYATSRVLFHRLVAWSVLHAERALEKTLQVLRHTTTVRAEGEASPFLREVAEHKKSLLKGSGKKRGAIYEE